MSDEQVKAHFANKLRELREAAGLSQEELGEKIGCSRGSISFYEKSQRVPDIIILKKASDFFSVSPAYMLGMGVKSPDPDAEIAVQYTGLSEKNIDFLNACVLVERYFTLYSSAVNSTPSDSSFLEWAEASGLRRKSQEELSKLPKLLDHFQRVDAIKTGEKLQATGEPDLIYGFCIAYLHFVNEIIETAKDNAELVANFISITPTARLGVGKLAYQDKSHQADEDSKDTSFRWETIRCGKEQIKYSEFIEFQAHKVGRAIETHLLEKYGYGND